LLGFELRALHLSHTTNRDRLFFFFFIKAYLVFCFFFFQERLLTSLDTKSLLDQVYPLDTLMEPINFMLFCEKQLAEANLN
jgi:hypothetical protein